jgi:hypothetical protein
MAKITNITTCPGGGHCEIEVQLDDGRTVKLHEHDMLTPKSDEEVLATLRLNIRTRLRLAGVRDAKLVASALSGVVFKE